MLAVNNDVRSRWIEAGKQVAAGGEHVRILCPQNQDGYLEIRWVPLKHGTGGEYWLRCPICGAHNEILIRSREPSAE